MIKEFVKIWDVHKNELREVYSKEHPEKYFNIVKNVIELLHKYVDKTDWDSFDPDPNRITQIDEGAYQGTLIYVIGECDYQPSRYLYLKIGYGSCSGCDTLDRIKDDSSEPPTEKQIDGYMMVSLHVIQQLKEMDQKEYIELDDE